MIYNLRKYLLVNKILSDDRICCDFRESSVLGLSMHLLATGEEPKTPHVIDAQEYTIAFNYRGKDKYQVLGELLKLLTLFKKMRSIVLPEVSLTNGVTYKEVVVRQMQILNRPALTPYRSAEDVVEAEFSVVFFT